MLQRGSCPTRHVINPQTSQLAIIDMEPIMNIRVLPALIACVFPTLVGAQQYGQRALPHGAYGSWSAGGAAFVNPSSGATIETGNISQAAPSNTVGRSRGAVIPRVSPSGNASASRAETAGGVAPQPSVAFGGRAPVARGENPASFSRGGFQGAREGADFREGRGEQLRRSVPGEVSRRWDLRHDYAWGHHRYHWSGEGWVIVEADPYYYSYEGPVGVVEEDAGVTTEPAADPVPTPAPAPEFAPAADPLDLDVQRALARLGFYRGLLDGLLGPGTRAAIVDFQADQGMEPNGRITRRLMDALGL